MLDPLIIDGLAHEPEENVIVVLLADGLDWEDESTHLSLLQDKLNTYAAYIEDKQYEQVLPTVKPDHAVIQLEFAYPPTENGKKLLAKAKEYLYDDLGIEIKESTDEE